MRVLEDAGLLATRKVGREKLHYLDPVPIQLTHDGWIGKYAAPRVSALARKVLRLFRTQVQPPETRLKAPRHLAAHRARLEEFHARGTLLMVGPFGDPQKEGSMGIFTTVKLPRSSRNHSWSTAWSPAGSSASGTRSSLD